MGGHYKHIAVAREGLRRMAKKSLSDLKAMLAAEKADALAAITAAKLAEDAPTRWIIISVTCQGHAGAGWPLARGLDRVADTIEGLMPNLMDIFAGSDEVVRFEPVGPEDGPRAQETDYVNHVFMQRNPGFLILYSFIKDALLSKVGIVKVWWEEREEEEHETYFDQPDDPFALLASDPEIEIVAHTEHPDPHDQPLPPQPGQLDQPMLHDVTVITRENLPMRPGRGRAAGRTGHRPQRPQHPPGELLLSRGTQLKPIDDQGFDRAQVTALPSYTGLINIETLNRDTVNEHVGTQGDESINPGMRQVRVTEHYIRMDYEGDGKPRLYRVTTGGEQAEVLKRDGEPDIVAVDVMPFAAMMPIIVTHRFFGRSIADLVMDIQRIKTALMRAILDNAYLSVNPRVEVAEAFASETTLDDLLGAALGGTVKQPERHVGPFAWTGGAQRRDG